MSRRRKSSQPAPFDPSDYLRVADFARERGVQSKVIRDWLKRRGLKRAPYYLRRGLYGYVRYDLAAEYAAPRETARPKGWPTLKSLKAELRALPGGSGVNYLERRIAAGELRVVTYRKVRYVDPDDYRRAVLLYKDRLPPAGLVLLRDLARETRRDTVAVVSWCERHKVPMHMFRHPRKTSLARYLYPADADRYRDLTRDTEARFHPERLAA